MVEGKVCPKCQKQMIRRDLGYAYATDPPQYPWEWWCGCGHREAGGVRIDPTDDQMALDEWKRANAN